MNRRDITAMLASAAAFGLSAPALATTASKELDENKNFELEDRPMQFKLNGRPVRIEWLLLFNIDRVLGIRIPQKVKHFNEKRVNLSKVPIIGGLTRKPLSGTVFANSGTLGPVHKSGNILAAFPDVKVDFPEAPAAFVPIPYPNVETSLSPGGKFGTTKVKETDARKIRSAPKFGNLHVVDGSVVFGMPGVALD